MHKSKVLFSIDGVDSVRNLKKFLMYIDSQAALGHIEHVQQCLGSWEGVMEVSFLMNSDDFDKVVRDTHFIEDQIAVLHVAGDTRQPCEMEMLLDGSTEILGPMEQVTHSKAMASQGWTYTNGNYYVVKED